MINSLQCNAMSYQGVVHHDFGSIGCFRVTMQNRPSTTHNHALEELTKVASNEQCSLQKIKRSLTKFVSREMQSPTY